MLRSLLLLSALGLAGCASGESEVPPAPQPAPVASGETAAAPEAPTADHGSDLLAGPTTYACADGSTFSVSPVGGGAVEVALGDTAETLQPQVGKQGVYGGGALEVWIAAEGAFVIRDGEITLTDCKAAAEV